MKAKERLIVALDVDSMEQAGSIIDVLADEVDIFKVGIAPFTGYGQEILDKLAEKGKKCFLDLKFYDIPNTVANAAREGAKKGVFMMNFHCLGGVKMMQAAVAGAEEGAALAGKEKPILLGVTILTSMNEEEMAEMGLSGEVQDKVVELSSLAEKAGLDGVVASAKEAEAIKRARGDKFVVVTPGVRPEFLTAGDQKRVLTPKQAIEQGADYLVVGRPILQAEDPAQAAKKIIEEIG
ncbi:MAG: orotidine-5'-phosphate decarboxylase [Candidatus Tantalella remota]|nr:orotidine-5'-phosphate decarboxylase [Candidatus Tantalella remota]